MDGAFLEKFREEYDPGERQSIFEELEWAVNHPEYDFTTLVERNRFTSRQIYSHIRKLHRLISENKDVILK